MLEQLALKSRAAIKLIGGAIRQVFQQKATEDYNTTGNFHAVFIKTFKILNLITLPGLLIIIFFGPQLFGFVLLVLPPENFWDKI